MGAKDIDGHQTYLGSLVYRNPRIEIREYDIPTPGPDEVLLQVKACGICGSDVHMAQADDDGYITVVVTAQAEVKMPVASKVLQVRRARIVGAQGHPGHGTFP